MNFFSFHEVNTIKNYLSSYIYISITIYNTTSVALHIVWRKAAVNTPECLWWRVIAQGNRYLHYWLFSQTVSELTIQILWIIMYSFYVKKNYLIISQFCTCHDRSAVMACAKLWSNEIIQIKIRVKIILTRFQLWTDDRLWYGSEHTHVTHVRQYKIISLDLQADNLVHYGTRCCLY